MEIGSDFYEYDKTYLKNDNAQFWNLGQDIKFTLTGRTAIGYVLENIKKYKNIKGAYLPNYICESVINTFKNEDIDVYFYDVYFENGLKYNIDLSKKFDVFFAMNYFGYSDLCMDEYIDAFKENGKIIIEDITHSLLSKKKYCDRSDYLIASLRKWFPIADGGMAVNRYGDFYFELSDEKFEELAIKEKAMRLKKKYIENNIKDDKLKNEYLSYYRKFNNVLNNKYKNYKMSKSAYEIINGIDIEQIIKSRNDNVNLIFEKLKNNRNISWISNLNEGDCLLFVPIILEHESRDNLRNYLIKKGVYLPIHWPVDEKLNSIFKNELSLVCDQRYTKVQIENYTDLIIEYLGG